MTNSMPKEMQQKLLVLEQQKQQLDNISQQKGFFKNQQAELDAAVRELENTGENKEVSKIVGPIMIKSDKQTLLKELEEKKDRIDKGVNRLEEQENQIRQEATKNQQEIQKYMQQQQEGGENSENRAG